MIHEFIATAKEHEATYNEKCLLSQKDYASDNHTVADVSEVNEKIIKNLLDKDSRTSEEKDNRTEETPAVDSFLDELLEDQVNIETASIEPASTSETKTQKMSDPVGSISNPVHSSDLTIKQSDIHKPKMSATVKHNSDLDDDLDFLLSLDKAVGEPIQATDNVNHHNSLCNKISGITKN